MRAAGVDVLLHGEFGVCLFYRPTGDRAARHCNKTAIMSSQHNSDKVRFRREAF